nr:MAG TPA: hypothetical protein [Caudoviricetes sp.]
MEWRSEEIRRNSTARSCNGKAKLFFTKGG